MRRAVAAGAAVAAALMIAVPAMAQPSCAVVDAPAWVLASSRLNGAVAALQRHDVDVRIVDERVTADTAAAPCTGSETLVSVGVSPDDTVTVKATGRVPRESVRRAERIMQARLASATPDVASGIAAGLEHIWQSQERRDQWDLPQAAEARPEEGNGRDSVLHVPSEPLAEIVESALRRTIIGLAAAATVVLTRLLYRRRQTVRADQARLREARASLAERYVDLDLTTVNLGLALDAVAARLGPPAAAHFRADAGDRLTRLQACQERAGKLLLSLAGLPSNQPRGGERARLAQACDDATDALEAALKDVRALLAEAPDTVAPVGWPDPTPSFKERDTWALTARQPRSGKAT